MNALILKVIGKVGSYGVFALLIVIGTLVIEHKFFPPKITLSCPPAPACKCPEQKPCNGIDFDKIKSKNITIKNEQHLTVSGDSVLMESLRQMVASEVDNGFKRNVRGKFLQ